VKVFREAYTYFNIVPSPLVPVMIEGSATAVTRGWGQVLELKPKELSTDPDDPEDKVDN
jgi:hypothetical protein